MLQFCCLLPKADAYVFGMELSIQNKISNMLSSII